MEIPQTLSAKQWQLTSSLRKSDVHGGILVIKNTEACTYLSVTLDQWSLLKRFEEPKMVPRVLEMIIEERLCPPLGEFYELILKAVQSRILVVPGEVFTVVPALNWALALNPMRLRALLWVLFLSGMLFTVASPPDFPLTFAAAGASMAWLLLAMVVGAALASSLLRGSGGEIYRRDKFGITCRDAVLLPPAEQRTVGLAPLAVLAATTGVLTWTRPEWSFFPLIGLLIQARPILGGRVNYMIRANAVRKISDTEHAFIFPPNRTPRARWRLLWASMRNKSTWAEFGHGVVWTLVLGYFVGVLTEVPPWTFGFWRNHVPHLLMAIAISLLVFGFAYGGWELWLWIKNRAASWYATMRQLRRRWFPSIKLRPDENACLRLVQSVGLLQRLPPPHQLTLARALQLHREGPWCTFQSSDQPATHISIIVSGQVGVYRRLPSGRRCRVQLLGENDLLGLHAVADQLKPDFFYRSLTPTVLLRFEWAMAVQYILPRFEVAVLATHVLKVPYLRRVSLCRQWPLAMVERFAELCRLVDYAPGKVIVREGFYYDNFFILYEGEALAQSMGRPIGKVRPGDFVGEIGLLQHSPATAQVLSVDGARGLCISRLEFMSFVTRNYEVALELERVSSRRLGHPIFPLTPGDFRSI